LAKDLTASPATSADPLFGAAWAAVGIARPSRPGTLPLMNGLAVAAIIAGVAYRLWEAHLPADVLRTEAILIGLGVVFGAGAIAIRASRFSRSLAVQIPIMACAAVLADLVLGVAGRQLGDELPPLAAVSFAAVFLHFEAGLGSRHFGFVFATAILGIGILWVYAVTQLTVSYTHLTLPTICSV